MEMNPLGSFGSFPEEGILGVLRCLQDLLPSTGNVAGYSVAGGSFLTNGIPEASPDLRPISQWQEPLCPTPSCGTDRQWVGREWSLHSTCQRATTSTFCGSPSLQPAMVFLNFPLNYSLGPANFLASFKKIGVGEEVE